MDATVLQALRSYTWPGNVRELENLVERVSVCTEGSVIRVSDLPAHLWSTQDNYKDNFKEPLGDSRGTGLPTASGSPGYVVPGVPDVPVVPEGHGVAFSGATGAPSAAPSAPGATGGFGVTAFGGTAAQSAPPYHDNGTGAFMTPPTNGPDVMDRAAFASVSQAPSPDTSRDGAPGGDLRGTLAAGIGATSVAVPGVATPSPAHLQASAPDERTIVIPTSRDASTALVDSTTPMRTMDAAAKWGATSAALSEIATAGSTRVEPELPPSLLEPAAEEPPISKTVEQSPAPMVVEVESVGEVPLRLPVDLPKLLRNLEQSFIEAALEQTRNNKKEAAKLLGMGRTTLVEKLRRWSISHRLNKPRVAGDSTLSPLTTGGSRARSKTWHEIGLTVGCRSHQPRR